MLTVLLRSWLRLGSPRAALIGLNHRLFVLAIGAFAIGTDGFVVAGILPSIASDLGVTLSQAGLLVSVFALSYAVFAPIAGALSGRWPRRTVLLGAMAVFALANLMAAMAESFFWLAVWRVAAALSAAIYSPAAVGIAVQMAPPEQRGRAASVVFAGLTISLVTGVPLGTFIAGLGTWRWTFFFVALVAALACFVLWRLLPTLPASPVATLSARLRPLRRLDVVLTLLSGFLWMTGGIAVYTYIVPLLQQATGWSEAAVSPVLLLYGAAAIAGNQIGGRCSDRFGPKATLVGVLFVHAVSLLCLALAAKLGPNLGLVLTVLGLPLFAASGWACTPPQASRLMALAPGSPVEMMSLSTSGTYFGISAGAAVGAWVIGLANIETVCLVGFALQVLALIGVAVSGSKDAAPEALP